MLRSRYRCSTPGTAGIAAVIAASLCLCAPAFAVDRAPGAPGRAQELPAGAERGLGTSATGASRVWFSLRKKATEAYYPDVSTPAVAGLALSVDAKPAFERVGSSLTYRVTAAKKGHWRLTKTFVTDPDRAVVLVQVALVSLDGKAHRLTLRLDPALSGDGDDDVGWTRGHALLAHDRFAASALASRPAFTKTSSGYAGHDRDLLAHAYDALRPGNVTQAARTSVTGLAGHRDLTLALGFGRRATLARAAAFASLGEGFDAVAKAYDAGWASYRASLKPAPAGTPAAYETALLALKASEDKRHPGAFASGADHLVRARDSYAIATALLAAGDANAASRALDFMLASQQSDDGTLPASTGADGTVIDDAPQLDATAFALVLAWQLARADAWTRVRKAADAIAAIGPETDDGYSPATMAAEIAGLVCAADLAVRNGDGARASSYTKLADQWASNVESWTTARGPFTPHPYYVKLTTARRPTSAQARAVDQGFLELVRLGVKKASDATIVRSVAVSDAHRRGKRTPVQSGERGEYELAAGRPASAQLASLAASATLAQPVLAELVRLAWSIPAGRPVERPGIVACRYSGVC